MRHESRIAEDLLEEAFMKKYSGNREKLRKEAKEQILKQERIQLEKTIS